MSDARIRTAAPRDLSTLGRLGAMLVQQHRAFDARRFIDIEDVEVRYADFLRQQMQEDAAVVLVAEREGVVVGYAFASIEAASMKELRDTAGFIHDLLVDESARQGSIGTALATAAIDWLRDHGAARVMLWSAERNPGAQRLFTRLGFRPTMVEMTKDLI